MDPKKLSHMIMIKVLQIDWIITTSVHEVMDMGQSSNWTFLLGLSYRFLHWMFKEYWKITSSILSDVWRSSYSHHYSYTRNTIIILEVIFWNGFDKHKKSIAYVRNTNLSIYTLIKNRNTYILIGNITHVFVSDIHYHS